MKSGAEYLESGYESLKSKAESVPRYCEREIEIIDMVTRDYDLGDLRNGRTPDEINRRIDKWKKCEDSIVTGEFLFHVRSYSTTVKNGRCFMGCSCGIVKYGIRSENSCGRDGSLDVAPILVLLSFLY